MGLHREGNIILICSLVLFAGLTALTIYLLPGLAFLHYGVAAVLIIIYVWFLWFFRVPKISVTQGSNLIIAPADGKVVVIENTEETEYLKDERLQISVFMSPLNVHQNRTPVAGKVKYFKYHPGKLLVAWHPKSSTENERTTMVMESDSGVQVLFRQIAGIMARRIKWYVKEGDHLGQGDEFGFIRFGSRVDT
jgi:phosphatidylserine decarboxylase